MAEPGQGQLLGAHRAAGRVGGFEHGDRPPGAGEGDGGSEPVRPAADHDGALDHGSGDPQRELVQHPLDPLGAVIACPQNACCASRPATA